MCGRGKSSRGRVPATKEKAKQSGEDSDDSVPQTKKRKKPSKEIPAAEAAEEVESLPDETAPKKSAQKPPD